MTMAKTSSNTSTSEERKRGALALLHDAAARLVAKEEPWAIYNIHSIPAERIVRHLYDPVSHKWSTEAGAASAIGIQSSLSQARVVAGFQLSRQSLSN
jgi:hypothetical protein